MTMTKTGSAAALLQSAARMAAEADPPLPGDGGGGSASLPSSHLVALMFALMRYCRLYGSRVLGVGVLSAMAVYRREMSCNRVFHHEDGEVEGEGGGVGRRRRGRRDKRRPRGGGGGCADWLAVATRASRRRYGYGYGQIWEGEDGDLDETAMDGLLDGAGHYCSGELVLALAAAFWTSLSVGSGVERGRDVAETEAEEERARSRARARARARAARRDGERSFSRRNWAQGRPDCGSLVRSLGHGSGSTSSANAATSSPQSAPAPIPLLELPPDATVHCLTYLHPRDVTTLACASRAARRLVDGEEEPPSPSHSAGPAPGPVPLAPDSISVQLWRELWWRDYGRVLARWGPAREALERSVGRMQQRERERERGGQGRGTEAMSAACRHLQSSLAEVGIGSAAPAATAPPSRGSAMKDFYLTFAAGWLDYCLAGRNTVDRCLVGLHGHAFDITDFIEAHPGSPETLLVQAGRDATAFFEDLGHSRGARRLALGMCAVTDRACDGGVPPGGCGLVLHRDGAVPDRTDRARTRGVALAAGGALPPGRSRPRRPAQLRRVRDGLRAGQASAQRVADTRGPAGWRVPPRDMLGSMRVYYDPFRGGWMAWYTSMDCEPVFVDEVLL